MKNVEPVNSRTAGEVLEPTVVLHTNWHQLNQQDGATYDRLSISPHYSMCGTLRTTETLSLTARSSTATCATVAKLLTCAVSPPERALCHRQ